jgi:DNA polymerase-3 subunit delta'
MQNFATAPYPWQEQQWQYLLNRYQTDNLPHALLLSGTKGLGQGDFALAFAKQVLCEQGKQTNTACGKCRACLLLQANSHPDLYLLQPEEEGKQIRIDVIRETIKQLNQTALQNNYKIILIQPADALNVAASNALLKNLEEPAGKTLFLLVCSELTQIAATIRSRCQLLQFTAPTRQMAMQWLQPLLKQGQNSELLLTLAEQAPLQALALAYEERLQDREQLFTHLNQISLNKAAPSQIAAKWLKHDVKELLNGFITIIVDCVRLNMGLPSAAILNSDKVEFIKQLAKNIAVMKLFTYLDELYQLRSQLNQPAQLNQQLLLENIFCKWYEYARFST